MNKQLQNSPSYVIFDLETTGRISTSCEITEIAALKVINSQIVETFQSLVKPTHHIPLEVQTITGITNEMVASSPAIDDILPKFLDFIENQLLVGYNIATFDLHVLNRHCVQHNQPALENSYIDLMYIARKSFPNLKRYKLVDVAQACNVSSNNAHRALADSYMVHECFNYIKEHFPSIEISPKLFLPSPISSSRQRYNSTTQALVELQNIILEIIADNILTESEVFYLKHWLDDNMHLSGNYPFDKIFSSIERALEDNILEKHELDELLLLFKQFSAPTQFLSNEEIQTLDKKTICLTGDFIHCDRTEVKKIIESKGGRCVSAVSGKTDYLFVGGYGSESWACGNYGSKIKKALELQEKGKSILICDEQTLFDFLDKANTDDQVPFSDDETYISRIQLLLDELIKHYELPDCSLYLDSNLSKKGENSGQESSKSICIFEPEYPPGKNVKKTLGRNFVVMNFKPVSDGVLELLIRNLQFDSISLPVSATVKTVKSDKTFHHVLFDANSDDLLEYIRNNIVFALANYKSSHSFGCCSRFIRCSDEKRCVHDNKLYSKGCKYRTHLEAGRIFYGKNANV